LGTQSFFVSLQIANPQIHGLIPQSQNGISEAFQSENRKSANLQGKGRVSDPDPHWFASNILDY
jgi:hypothetical protein